MQAEAVAVDQFLAGDREAVERVVASESADPHALLGAHPHTHSGSQGVVIRVFLPECRDVALLHGGKTVPMQSVHSAGLYVHFVFGATLPLRYDIEYTDAEGTKRRTADPYRFPPTIGDLDMHLHNEGTHYRVFEKLGAHPRVLEGVEGVSFCVWAPHAKRVSVVGTFNAWDGRFNMMRRMGSSGLWELFVPGVEKGALYKYEIKTQDGHLRMKTDPVAFEMEHRPNSASVVCGLGHYQWSDGAWMRKRAETDPRSSPMVIYEVHLGSWMRGENTGLEFGWLSYRDLAPKLVEHCKAHGFTHIELLPVAEHAYDPSWGYQTTGYYAPTARYGKPDDLRYMIDLCHQNGIGVFLDWVPAHFPKDDYALRWFDGSCIYEHSDPREGEHRDWGTLIFNYGRHEVRAFLLSNALYWLEQFHFDGLRVDAVASMIYRDYSRPEGQWIPNQYGGREHIEAISFLQELNTIVYGEQSGVITIAEESTAWPGVTQPSYLGGLGFGFKWNMGWMHDTLHYFNKEPVHRKYHHNDLTFSMLYAWTENFILPLSHDEVVHGKASLLSKMPGDDWQKAANLRLLLTYFYCHPGKKLIFMGGEFGQWPEWDFSKSLEWQQLEHWPHNGIDNLSKALGAMYRQHDALWAWDCEPKGFHWIDCTDSEQSVIAFRRCGPSSELVCVFNLTPVPRHDYRIGVQQGGTYLEYLNSDAETYGGSNVGNAGQVCADEQPFHGLEYSVNLVLPPLGGLVLEAVPDADAADDTSDAEDGGEEAGAH